MVFFLESAVIIPKRRRPSQATGASVCVKGETGPESCEQSGVGRHEKTLRPGLTVKNSDGAMSFIFRQLRPHERSLGSLSPSEMPFVCASSSCDIPESYAGEVTHVVREKGIQFATSPTMTREHSRLSFPGDIVDVAKYFGALNAGRNEQELRESKVYTFPLNRKRQMLPFDDVSVSLVAVVDPEDAQEVENRLSSQWGGPFSLIVYGRFSGASFVPSSDLPFSVLLAGLWCFRGMPYSSWTLFRTWMLLIASCMLCARIFSLEVMRTTPGASCWTWQ